MINVTHPVYPPQTIEEKWLDKFLANGWTVEDGQVIPQAAHAPIQEAPKRGRPAKAK